MHFAIQPRHLLILSLIFFTIAFPIIGNRWLNTESPSLDNGTVQPALSQPTLAQATQGENSASPYQITVTQAGFLPQSLSVPIGSQVIWLNTTGQPQTLRSGVVQRIFLPLMSHSRGSVTSTDIENAAASNPTAQNEDGLFTATLLPGKSFTFTFGMTGTFPFYLENEPKFTGSVVVNQPDDGLPPDPANVAPPLDQTVSTSLLDASSFLFTGANPIQTGVLSGTMEFQRVAVLRGRVLHRDGTSLPGVKVSILDHPEFGQTRTRADGMFDLAVNGGGLLTIDYAEAEHLPVQRQVQTPWQDYIWLPDVVMIALDSNVTTIDLAANTPIQVARGSVISDADGMRQETLLFPHGTTAVMTLTNGATQTLTTLHVRSTEYTVGADGRKAMPAALPANSAYTYASEFSADEAVAAGATDLSFSQPILSYNENFLNFPVGSNVPLGYYDRNHGVWISADNGRVIKILSSTAGRAELDIDGSGVAASAAALSALGVSDDERTTLANLYTDGQTLWRTPIRHFSAWDKNQGTSCQEPCPSPDIPTPENPNLDNPDAQCGSIIGCQNQTLGEVVDVSGTPFSLHYQSERVAGYRAARRLIIPLSGSTIEQTLKRIEMVVEVAGQITQQSFAAAPNLSHTYEWDGRDAYGRNVQGKQPVTVRLTYVYPLVYQATSRFGYNGGGAVLIGGSQARADFTITKVWQGTIGGWNTPAEGLGGWRLNVHHAYDPNGYILYLGDGGRRSSESLNFGVINTVAGSDTPGYGGDGGPATQARLHEPNGVAVGADGTLYIADTFNLRIRRVGVDGIITTVAGNGALGFTGDGGPAIQATLNNPEAIAVGPDGTLYIADTLNQRIRRVGVDGIISMVAGNGTVAGGYSGDGGPANQAALNYPRGIAVGPEGSLYIADSNNKRIRRVGVDGIITTVAGNGALGFSGDGGPATQAKLNNPEAIAVGADGVLYIADSGNQRIRRVGVDGIITTIAGTGQFGYDSNGGPAIEAKLNTPRGIAVAPNGTLYIADYTNMRIRRIDVDGIITTVAGNGIEGASGDRGPAPQARLNRPTGIAVGPNGTLYIAERNNQRIRQVMTSALPGSAEGDIVLTAEDGSELYIFNSTGRHLRTLHALTGAILYAFAYDNEGRLLTITDGDGNNTTIIRDASGNPTTIVGPYGQQTTLTLDANGYFSSISNPANETVKLSYTAEGLLTQLIDPRGNPHTFSYDADGRLIRDANPAAGFMALTRLGTEQTYTVTLRTALTRTTTYQVENLSNGALRRLDTFPNGLQSESQQKADGTHTQRDTDGTTQSVTFGSDPRWGMLAPVSTLADLTTPAGLKVSLQMTRSVVLTNTDNPFSLVTLSELSSINGRAYSSTYTAATLTLVDRSPSGRGMTTTLDALGRVVFGQLADLSPATYSYDAHGRLVTATLGSGAEARTVSLMYDSAGYLATVADPLKRSVHFEYDVAGRLIKQTQPDGRVIGYAYDANGNLTSLTPPGRPSHTFSYTPIDLSAQYTPPDVNLGADATQYSYNADRQLAQVARPDGQMIKIGYDGAGRLNALTIGRGLFVYTYHPTTGNLSAISAPGGSELGFSYDGSLLTSQSWTGAVTGSVGYSYDNNLHRTAITVNGANAIAYGYDNDSLLTSVGALTLSRNTQNGLLTGSTLGSVSDAFSYNGFGEPISYTARFNGTALLGLHYEYDKLGRIITRTETTSEATNLYVYGYDLAGRLATVRQNGATISSYSYDANGNRLSYTGAGSPINGIYDNQDRLLQYGSATYTYSANGELRTKTVSGQTTTYSYDELGNLVNVSLPDGTAIEYLIDGLNRRIGKKVNGVLVQGFLYDGQLRIVAELDSAGAVASRFVYATHINVPDYMVKGGVTYRILTDHLGSPRLMVDAATGAVVQAMAFDEFGRVLNDTNPGFQPFGFAGGLYDHDTELVRLGARDYDSVTGRWTAKDPVEFIGGDTNLYGYVMNNPVNMVDPTGLTFSWLDLGKAMVTGGASGVLLGVPGGPQASVAGFGIGAAAGAAVYLFGEIYESLHKTIAEEISPQEISPQKSSPTPTGDNCKLDPPANDGWDCKTNTDGQPGLCQTKLGDKCKIIVINGKVKTICAN